MAFKVLDALVPVACLALSFLLYKPERKDCSSRPRSYLLQNQVTHARLLPKESAHAFTYPTICFLVSLDALEQHRLDLARGWVFGYGNIWGRLTGLRPQPYLAEGGTSFTEKLEDVLRKRGFPTGLLHDAWIMTMPSFLGFEGINPLTVYFCYDTNGSFRFTMLEIHNTFGESHVHVLEVDHDEDESVSTGYDHQWTFPRQFHVSPFNDRSGFYTVSIKSPSHPPTQSHTNSSPPPKPAVRVHQYTASEGDPTQRGELKLTALLRPTHATPLTTPSLLSALACTPFAFLLTFPRILCVAWILHYRKRLDVYLRPDPLPAVNGWNEKPPAGGVKWLEEGGIERLARNQVTSFLQQRSKEMKTTIVLVSADPRAPRLVFEPTQEASMILKISYTSPRFFSILLLSPSAKHALLLGRDTEHIFHTSDEELFLSVFSASSVVTRNQQWLQSLRRYTIPASLDLAIPKAHYLDQGNSKLSTGIIIIISRVIGWIEKQVFSLARARVVAGLEPWKQWERAAARYSGFSSPFVARNVLGSVRNGESDASD